MGDTWGEQETTPPSKKKKPQTNNNNKTTTKGIREDPWANVRTCYHH